MFNMLRSCQTVFLHHFIGAAWCSIRKTVHSPHPNQHLLLPVFVIKGILVTLRWYLILILGGYEVVPPYNSDLHFPDGPWRVLSGVTDLTVITLTAL